MEYAPSQHDFDGFFPELPIPSLGDLSDLRQLHRQRAQQSQAGGLGLRYSDLCRLDTVNVQLVPEKKGLFLKHVEYVVTSKVSEPIFQGDFDAMNIFSFSFFILFYIF